MSFPKFFFALALALFAFTSCHKKEKANQKPLILVSIAPYRTLVQQIAGPSFDVQTIVPSSANPHSFEPILSQVTQMGRADIWFSIGEPFEAKIAPILQARNPQFIVSDLRKGLSLIEEVPSLECHGCLADRHIWLSPKLTKLQAETIEKALSQKYPENRALFSKNRIVLCEQLTALDEEIRSILKETKNRTLLVSHPAFGYFCKEFNLHQLSVEYEGKDPRPKHLEAILKRATEERAQIALALPQYNNKGAQLIAEKLHKPVRYIDPYSEGYFEMMRKLALLIADPYAN